MAKPQAQGNALGNVDLCDLSPEGAKPGFEMSFAPSGLRFSKHAFPGRCPGLRSDRPLGAQITGKTLMFPPKSAHRNAIGGHRTYKCIAVVCRPGVLTGRDQEPELGRHSLTMAFLIIRSS